MDAFDYVIVGGGLAAASAVDGIRERDGHGTIVLLTDEDEPPYHRPPLSKEYLQHPEAGRDMLHVKPENWFEEEATVDLRPGTRVALLDPRELTLTTVDGDQLRGERILLATGGRPRELTVDGHDLDRVVTLRTVEDSERIRSIAGEAERAVLIGAGFIGMELAASLRQHGVSPVVVEVRDRVWPRMLPPPLSAWVRDYFEDRGVEFRLGVGVSRFRGGEDGLEAVVLDSGEEVACELAVAGIGIEPRSELATEAGLAVKDGIVVDAYGETSHGYIYASGDVARFPDPIFGDVTRVEHWDHAKAHGRLVGRNMAGAREAYDHLSYFFSDVFDLSFNVLGRPEEADRTIVRGDLSSERSLVFCGADGRLCAAILVNANDALEDCRELVRRRPALDDVEARLEDPGAELAGLAG